METEASRQLALEGFSEDKMVLLRQADMRYLHQAYELTLELKHSGMTRETMHALIEQFHESHERAYGYARREEPVEFVNLRLVALGKLPDLRIQKAPVREAGPPEPVTRRRVYFGGRAHDTAVFSRTELSPGQVVEGPAVIEQLDSTTVVTPGYQAQIDPRDNLNIYMKETAQ
jgi:N-methylhydantoinase A